MNMMNFAKIKPHKIVQLSLMITIMIGVFSTIPKTRAVIAPPSWMKVGAWAEYHYFAYEEIPGTPVETTYRWSVTAIVDDPWDPYATIKYDIVGISQGTFQVYFSDGDWQTYFPLKAFTGALPLKIEFAAIGEISTYVLPQTYFDADDNIWGGETYYDDVTGVMVCLNMVSGSYYERMIIKATSTGLLNTRTPTTTKIDNLETTVTQQGNSITALQSTSANLTSQIAGATTVFGMSVSTFLMLVLAIAVIALVMGLLAFLRKPSLPPPP
jgi:hypothetical protein